MPADETAPEPVPDTVPDGVPDGASAWTGSDLAATPERWTHHWTDRELADLFSLTRGIDTTDAGPAPAQLLGPTPDDTATSLTDLADRIRADLIEGLGFALLKGYPVGEIDRRTEALGFLMLGRLLGSLRSQNAHGHLLGHVRDVGRDPTDPTARIYQTNDRQTFHTDSVDAVGLLCRTTAKDGGRSLLASATTAYRLVVERRPDLAPHLFEPIATDRRGEVPDGAEPWFEIPVLSWHDERLTVIYQRTYIDSAARFERAPRPSAKQIAALDLWDDILNEPGVAMAMDLEPGDIQFVHNHSLLHDRTAFVDHTDPERRRHLLRLWVSLSGDRELPPVFAQRYGSVTVGDRGGITLVDTELCVPLLPPG
ncbi:MAG: TauD/TfdA family dioxygenase [Acidimicrobiia bacterium]|nr:TauD/TfdA family dioxygenase [Acidimicrobiia bacterium]